MLAQILHYARKGGVLSVRDIAGGLNVTPAMAEEMCLELARLGYFRAVNADCGVDACAACGVKHACSSTRAPRLWTLTEKSARFLERASH